jgi:hypothetical protein
MLHMHCLQLACHAELHAACYHIYALVCTYFVFYALISTLASR